MVILMMIAMEVAIVISIVMAILIAKVTIISIILSFLFAPEGGLGLTLGLTQFSPVICLKEVIESATLNPLCYPNSY